MSTNDSPTPRSPKQILRLYGGVFIRGLCMGAADLVPGVSGGTIAFISGIYDRLLTALAAFAKPPLWRDLLRFDIAGAWRRGDCNFLLALFAGIGCAVLTLSGVLHHLLETRAHVLLGFFFGLVVASVFVVWRQVDGIRPRHIVLSVIAACLTFLLVTGVPTLVGGGGVALFFGGMVAIGAMLLPGISGSYILLILGLYPIVITAAHERDIAVLVIFVAGCGCGILAFSRLLSYLLSRWKTPMIAILAGIMVGALPKLWPWKEAAAGAKIILQANVAPADYAGMPEIFLVVVLAIVGAVVVLGIDRFSNRR